MVYDDPNHYIKNLPLLIANVRMANRRILIIVAIIIVLISVITIFLAPSDTIIHIPIPDDNKTLINGSDVSKPPQSGPNQRST